MSDQAMRRRRRVVVIGSGTHFLSGVSVYTLRLANALAEHGARVRLITMRRLIPARLYPGWKRVGADLTSLVPDPHVARFDGVDWFWVPSILRAAFFLLRGRPETVVFQWWTGAVAHSYIALALLARLAGARVLVEFHEIITVEDAARPLFSRYVRTLAPVLFGLADGFALHSEYDRLLALTTWHLGDGKPLELVPLGPFNHYHLSTDDAGVVLREAPAGVLNLLFFGVIRPYKGLEHLVEAFEQIPEEEIDRFWLTVVGETWEDYEQPIERIQKSPRRNRITLVNRYVTDDELSGHLGGADAIVLPYLRSSISGPLHVAMARGLPTVMTDVGGNTEAAQGYEGVTIVPPADSDALTTALRALPGQFGKRFEDPHSWAIVAAAYERLFARIDDAASARRRSSS